MKFVTYSRDQLSNFADRRTGEQKLVDTIQVADLESLASFGTSYVLIGIPEDVGVRANHGIGGTHTLWPAFVSSFLGMQSNKFLDGREIILLGHLDIDRDETIDYDTKGLREYTAKIDTTVRPIILATLKAGHIPIIIGGGHNNAYPIIAACSDYHGGPIATLNMDLHHDYRIREGRHSGNPFRYAMDDGYLDQYLMWGVSKYYSQQYFLDEWAADDRLFAIFYEAILMNDFKGNLTWLEQYISSLESRKMGLEIDLDSVQNVLSSAMTPSGFSPKEIRAYLSLAASHQPWYLHICEGAVRREDGLHDATAPKLAALLVADFISNYKTPLTHRS